MPLFYKEKEILWADPSFFTSFLNGPVFPLYIFLKESVYHHFFNGSNSAREKSEAANGDVPANMFICGVVTPAPKGL
jgi:hypothetical protein